MAVTGWKTPDSCVTVDRDGKDLWVNPFFAGSSNDVYALCDIPKLDYNDWLRATEFGFGLGDIPLGATIDGIEAKVEGHGEVAGKIGASAVYLRKTAGQVGDNKAGLDFWGINDSDFEYGGAADDWNAGLVDTDIRSVNFGLDFSAANIDNANAVFAYVDCISIRVYYTVAAAHKRSTFFKMF